ncbi:hypothetical protein LNO88_06555 [Klebsiella pneumoniae subsp. pneumoniae]|nr:hypothetical protein [Klebsiella pneumoniae subsp. pneumoniae]
MAAGALVAFSFTSMPKGFLPQEDQGSRLFASVQLPEAASAGAYRSGDGPGAQAAVWLTRRWRM